MEKALKNDKLYDKFQETCERYAKRYIITLKKDTTPLIKEIKYKNFRFYFITDGYKLKVMDKANLVNLLIRFVRMSNKKDQQETINEIKKILTNFGSKGFDD